MQFNFIGPFRHRHGFQETLAVQEPESAVKNYHQVALNLLETFKRFIVQFNEHAEVSADMKFMLGSVIWEYMLPLMQSDPFLMEELMLQFFFDLMNINKEDFTETVLRSMEIHFSPD